MPGNRSFADPAGDGYDHTNPLGAGSYLGVCNPANPASAGGFDPDFPCNDKLIGAYVFDGQLNGNSALDYDGHGSHTASTSGGNVVDDVVVEAPTLHHAAVRHLRRRPARQRHLLPRLLHPLRPDGGDRPGDRRRGRRHQLLDRLVRARRRCGTTSTRVGFLNARAAGIFVATSNGNDGPGDATTGSPADAPWLTSVGRVDAQPPQRQRPRSS